MRVTSGDQGIWHEEPCCNFSDLTRTLVEAEYTFSLHTNSSSRRIEGRTPLAKVASKIHHKIELLGIGAIRVFKRFSHYCEDYFFGFLMMSPRGPKVRERLSIPQKEWNAAAERLCAYPGIREASILSTCNRFEVRFVMIFR